jgi:hypothetical protein
MRASRKANIPALPSTTLASAGAHSSNAPIKRRQRSSLFFPARPRHTPEQLQTLFNSLTFSLSLEG